MLHTARSKSNSSPLNDILQSVPQLTHVELLELITFLAQQAQQTAVSEKNYYWRDIAGIAPNLLGGRDAQDWIDQTRQEWDRGKPQ